MNYLTAEMSDFIIDDAHAWNTGVWIQKDNTQAKIEENRYMHKITIELAGHRSREEGEWSQEVGSVS